VTGATPAQTIGPFFAVLLPLAGPEMVPPGTPGAIVIHGTVLDGLGDPVPDALIEAWQADPAGHYGHAGGEQPGPDCGPDSFTGFGRTATGPRGEFSFTTLKPGRVSGSEEQLQAPHVTLSLFARGLLRHLVTRVYFPDERQANGRDPLLQSIAEPEVRATLIAAPDGPGRYRFDIRLQGEGETAFLAI
jgi:protocatechuate 3,4-dioxygenase alpha subunit